MDGQMAGVAAGAAARRGVASAAGRVVAFLGPDGAGKSTAIAALRQRLVARGTAVRSYHWRVPWQPASGEGDMVNDPHGRPLKGLLASVAQVGFHLLTAWPAWWRHVAPARRQGEWILLDRCFLDLLCDPRRYRCGAPRWLARAAAALMPRADRLVVLHAPPEVIRARKREVEPDELLRQLKAYRACGQACGGIFIDSADAPEVVACRVASAVGLT